MTYYEKHQYTDANLPIIYHCDTVSKGDKPNPNWHENIELLFCVSGEGEAVISSNAVSMKKNSVIIINSGKIHYTTAFTDKLIYHCLIIDSDFLEEAGFLAEIYDIEECILDPEVSDMMENIAKELKEKKPFYEAAVKGEIMKLFSYLYRCYAKDEIKGENDTMIKNAIKYMKKNYKEQISVESVAKHVGFSRFYFSRCFKKVTGYTVNDYIAFLRCREAKKMLMKKDALVSEVAAMCGFGDVSYFTKVFKRHEGICPSKVVKSDLSLTNKYN